MAGFAMRPAELLPVSALMATPMRGGQAEVFDLRHGTVSTVVVKQGARSRWAAR